jgi:hypothetical protein
MLTRQAHKDEMAWEHQLKGVLNDNETQALDSDTLVTLASQAVVVAQQGDFRYPP